MLCERKKEGQYMTPKRIVDIVLDGVGYTGSDILEKAVIEPSFGSGAFLVKILERITAEGRKAGKTAEEIAAIIHSNVYGIEKDEYYYSRAIHRLDNFMSSHNLPAVSWDNLVCGDTLLLYEDYQGKFDYVVGNPPFVNVHNLSQEYKELAKAFEFTTGMPDMYVIFYEIGLTMLNESGRLGFVSPASLLKNVSQKTFRDSLIDKKYISEIYDFKDSHIFETADVYVCVAILDKSPKENYSVVCRTYRDTECTSEARMPYQEFVHDFKGKLWNFCSEKEMQFLKSNAKHLYRLDDFTATQNGVATQRDEVYIGKVFLDKECTVPYMQEQAACVYFKGKNGEINELESGILRRCVKASRFEGQIDNTYILFPYKPFNNGFVPLAESELAGQFPKAYAYLEKHKDKLLARDMDENADWFLFGRSQGLLSSNMKKIVFKHIINGSLDRITPYVLDEDVIVYSGCYTVICGDKLSIDDVCRIISSPDFMKYCRLKGKSMSGGYFSISTKIIKEYGIEGSVYEV